jgi:hypothetical protein
LEVFVENKRVGAYTTSDPDPPNPMSSAIVTPEFRLNETETLKPMQSWAVDATSCTHDPVVLADAPLWIAVPRLVVKSVPISVMLEMAAGGYLSGIR